MTAEERAKIKKLEHCDFTDVLTHIDAEREKRKNRSKEEKTAEKEKNAEIIEKYGFCMWDGHREKVGNFRLEPPGLFRGRGEHPKMGNVKKRIKANEIIINCSKVLDINCFSFIPKLYSLLIFIEIENSTATSRPKMERSSA